MSGWGWAAVAGQDARSDAHTLLGRDRAGYDLRKGHSLDNKYKLELENRLWNRGQRRGLTAQEYYGSPVAGQSGPSGGANVLGSNTAAQMQMQSQAAASSKQALLGYKAQIDTAKIQKQSAETVARIQAGVQERGQDVQQKIADNILALDKQRLQDIEIPQAQILLKLTNQQYRTEVNKTVTSSAKFQKEMKQMSMGPANLLVELTLRHHGISLANKSFENLSEKKRKEILDELMAMASKVYIEGKGGEALGRDAATSNPADTFADWIARLITAAEGGGIESSNAPRNSGKAILGTASNPTNAYSIQNRDVRRRKYP